MRARFHIIAVVTILSTLPPCALFAQDVEPTESPTPTVVISPLGYHPAETSDIESAAIVTAIHDGLAEAFRTSEATDAIDRDDLVRQTVEAPLYSKTVELGESWATMGIDAYKGLDLEGAVRSLSESVDSFEEVGHDLVAPRRFAELLMFLSVSHLERRSQMVEPLDRMQEMILYDPGRVLERGFYPERVVQFYESARVALERDLRRGPDIELSQRLVEMVGADYVAFASVFEDDGEYEMVAFLWDPSTEQALPAETIGLESLDPELVRSAANRLGSRLVACIAAPDVVTQRVAPSDGSSPFAMQLSFAYSSFFDLPGPDWLTPFPNVGASFGAGWALTREFSAVTMVQILTSVSEFSGGLVEDFTTLRAFAGIDLTWTFWNFAAGLSTQLELAKVGDIVTCNVERPRISDGDVGGSCEDHRDPYSAPLLLGINARPKLGYQILRSVELQTSVSLSYYFLPLNDQELNLPVTMEAGLVYRF